MCSETRTVPRAVCKGTDGRDVNGFVLRIGITDNPQLADYIANKLMGSFGAGAKQDTEGEQDREREQDC